MSHTPPGRVTPTTSTELLAAIVASSDDAIVTKDLEGIITSWNSSAERMFGYRPDEAIGRSITLIIPPELHEEEREVLAKVRSGVGLSHFETVRVARDGRLLDISLTVSPLRNADGVIVGASKIARDITERKAAAHRLAEEARIADALSRIGADLAATLDPKRLVQSVVNAARTATGASIVVCCSTMGGEAGIKASVCGMSPESSDANWEIPKAAAELMTSVRSGAPVRVADLQQTPIEHAFETGLPEGQVIRSYLAVPIAAPAGEVVGALCCGDPAPGVFNERHEKLLMGIAGWASVGLQNASLYGDAQAANRSKDTFLATLSHELRTPLNAILGWAQLLGTVPMDEGSRKRAVETIERNARLQARLIEELLDASRIITGKLVVRQNRVEITAIMAAAVEEVRAAASNRGIAIDIPASGREVFVVGDSDRLRQIIWNLLSNAVKFSEHDSRVRVTLDTDQAAVRIAVIDEGVGIAPASLPVIFDRFGQVDATSTRRQGGLGLGLGIVKHLTEVHHGKITASSEGLGKGSAFVLALPLAADNAVQPLASAEPYAEAQDLSTVTVIVVDDEPDAVELAAFVLRERGATVRTASSVPEALRALEQSRPDALVADISMPERDGYDLIETVRRSEMAEGLERVTAIALTAFSSPAEQQRILAAGFDWHLPKPVAAAALVSLVARSKRRNAI